MIFHRGIIKTFEANIINSSVSKEDISNQIELASVFGNNTESLSSECLFKEACTFSGDLFNGEYNNNPYYKPDIDKVKYWFYLFNNHHYLATNLHLIQQSFILFNKYYHSVSYFDPSDLLNGIILLVLDWRGFSLKIKMIKLI